MEKKNQLSGGIQYENKSEQNDLLESLMPGCNSCYLIESLQAQH